MTGAASTSSAKVSACSRRWLAAHPPLGLRWGARWGCLGDLAGANPLQTATRCVTRSGARHVDFYTESATKLQYRDVDTPPRSRPLLRLIPGGGLPGDYPPGTPDLEPQPPESCWQAGPSTTSRLEATLAILLAEETREHLRRVLRRRGVRAKDLEDVVQEVLIIACRALDRFDPERADVRAWVAGIASRYARDYRRYVLPKQERETAALLEDLGDVADDAPDPEDQAIAMNRQEVLKEMLYSIPEVQFQIVTARDLLEMEFPEIATELRMPEGTVRNHYRLGRLALQAVRTRWQARQKRRVLAIVPALLAPFVAAKRAWARTGPPSVAAKLSAIVAASVVGIWCIAPERTPPPVVTAAAPPPAEEVAPTVEPTTPSVEPATPVNETPIESSPPSTPPTAVVRLPPEPTRPGSAEQRLMQQAKAALLARNYAMARMLLEKHARSYPDGAYAAERRVLIRLISEPTDAPP